MISGLFLSNKRHSQAVLLFNQMAAKADSTALYCDSRLLLSLETDTALQGETRAKSLVAAEEQLVICWQGAIYNLRELRAEESLGKAEDPDGDCALILLLYKKHGEDLANLLVGTFAIMIYDMTRQQLILIRDRFGVESLYYLTGDGYLAFSSTIPGVLRVSKQTAKLFHPAIGKILLFNYNPGLETLVAGVRRLAPAHILSQPAEGKVNLQRYWELTFCQKKSSETEISRDLLAHLRQAVASCIGNNPQVGIFLSGGMDSSTVAALTRENRQIDIDTFSYRCRAASFDESRYARIMSEFVNSRHNESDYGHEHVLQMPEVVEGMNEPFCDVGINIATYLLGRSAAKAGTRMVMTGDGGDELFAGHPVYEADKIARFADKIPSPMINPFLALFRQLPDSDKKKSLSVKLKRFSESLSYPAGLLSHRWRIYYDAGALQNLTRGTLDDLCSWDELLGDILAVNRKAGHGDPLSMSLYSDYHTVMDFYLRRNDLIRRFGIDVRYPLLDHRLVELCAALPGDLKIKGWFDTKYIFKKTMEPVLPHEIIYRKDKLGHSIPLKNWIRDEKPVREMILDHLSADTIRKRGLFNHDYIAGLTNDHLAKRKNNSHRLWTLAVLEMWLRHNMQ